MATNLDLDPDLLERALALSGAPTRLGVQIGTIDAILAQLCIRYELRLLTTDVDFARFAEHEPSSSSSLRRLAQTCDPEASLATTPLPDTKPARSSHNWEKRKWRIESAGHFLPFSLVRRIASPSPGCPRVSQPYWPCCWAW